MDVCHPARASRVCTAMRLLTRILAVLGGLLSILIILGVVGELRGLQQPFVLDEAPFGTYAQPTQLSLLTFGAAEALFLVGAALTFRWEAAAARILLLAGGVQIVGLIPRLLDSTFPRMNIVQALVLAVLPPLIIGGLLLVSNRLPQPEHMSEGD